ncbi:MAG: hypothetical protein V6Z81_04885 [Parvularculales bacterium]
MHRAAIESKTPAVVELLLAHGADGRAQDKKGKIPFDYAEDNEALKNTKAYWLLNEAQYR